MKPRFLMEIFISKARKKFFRIERVCSGYREISLNIKLYARKKIMLIRRLHQKLWTKQKNPVPRKNLPRTPLYAQKNQDDFLVHS